MQGPFSKERTKEKPELVKDLFNLGPILTNGFYIVSLLLQGIYFLHNTLVKP